MEFVEYMGITRFYSIILTSNMEFVEYMGYMGITRFYSIVLTGNMEFVEYMGITRFYSIISIDSKKIIIFIKSFVQKQLSDIQ